MALKLYNSLSRKKEIFKPINDDRISVYTCGPTVYDVMHIGHARTYSTWDILVRYLKFIYPDRKITHIQNYTDVGHLTDDADAGDDKILERAKKRKIEPMELVDYYTRQFEDSMSAIDINFPNITPRATAHISEMIQMVESLIEKGNAYETDKGIYFDVSTFEKYGQLANLDLESQKSGARVEIDGLKRNPHDFALFIKAPEEHIMKWPTPWGWLGYPGWHIECSAMSIKYLGESIDIHGGGIDHLPIHHTNERAQSECFTGKNFVNYWLHANFMTLQGEKMSKSTGNYISALDAIKKFGSKLFRYYLVTSNHYRTLDDFTYDKLDQKNDEFEKLMTSMANIESLLETKTINSNNEISKDAQIYKQKFIEAMNDDLNTPVAMSVVFNFVNYLNTLLKKATNENNVLQQLKKDYELFLEISGVLAIYPLKKEDFDELLSDLLELRQEARKQKNYEMSDRIRDIILKRGYKVEDKPWGSHVIRYDKKGIF